MPSNIPDVVSDRLKRQQSASPERRRYLEQLAQLMCRNYNPTVNFQQIRTARCRHVHGEMMIDVCQEMIGQTVTDLDEDVWCLVAQEGLLIHEIGHVLYTDFDAHEEIKDQLGMREMNAFHDIVWNPAEDAAIEEQLRWKFNCSRELDTYNANLFHRQKSGAHELPIPQAVKISILEKGCYDAGALDEHLQGKRNLVNPDDREVFDDKIVPEINAMLADVMTEPDPNERYERMLEFWKWLKDIMQDEQGQDAVQEQQNGQGSGYDEAKPDDTSGMTPGEMADALEDLDEDEVREQLEDIAQPEPSHDWDEILDEDDEAEEDDAQEGAGQGDGEEADEGDEDDPSLGDLFSDPDGEDEEADEGEEDGEHGHDTDGDSNGPDSDDSQPGDEDDGKGGDEGGDEQGDSEGGSGDGEGQPGGSGLGEHEDHRLVIRD